MAKILIVGSSTSPLTTERGCVGQIAGHQIYWFSDIKAKLPGVISYGLPVKLQSIPKFKNLFETILLKTVLNKVKPDLIHVHYAVRGLVNFFLLNFHPLIVTVMGSDLLTCINKKGINAFFARKLLNSADCITSKSNYMDLCLSQIGHFQSKIQRITWGINLNQFHSKLDYDYLYRKWNIPPNDFVFFDPRNVKKLYNKHIIIDAFRKYLSKYGPNATLLIAGSLRSLKYFLYLNKLVNNYGIGDKVRFIGNIKHSEMPFYYNISNATISIPDTDGMPQTIYEALACGSFLILGNLPQYRESIKEGITGCFVPFKSSDELSSVMRKVVEMQLIKEQVARIGQEFVRKNAEISDQTFKVNKIYKELLAKYEYEK